MVRVLVAGVAVWCLSGSAGAEEPQVQDDTVRAAATRGLRLIESSTVEYRRHRKCFSCHHQAVPLITLAAARQRGFAIDEENFQTQLKWTADHLSRGREAYQEGRGQGGRADTAGYALWALAEGEWTADETTAVVADYLLNKDAQQPFWRKSSNRPPSEASDVTTTAVAIYGLQAYGTAEQAPQIAERTQRARDWLLEHQPRDTEEHVFGLLALSYLDASAEALSTAGRRLLDLQREDGGWGQTADLASDAYATGTALYALHACRALTPDEEAYRRGLQFLLKAQLDDGSWHVQSRSKPFQTYFESGFPHGKDQFISMSASCWAVAALVQSLPAAEASAEEGAPKR